MIAAQAGGLDRCRSPTARRTARPRRASSHACEKPGRPAARSIKLLPVATETPTAVLSLQDYRSPPPRLAALTWGAEDLSAALGAATNRDENGEFLFTYKMVRALVPDRREGGRRRRPSKRCTPISATQRVSNASPRAAQREGFSGMLAIHPDQVEIDQRRLHALRRPTWRTRKRSSQRSHRRRRGLARRQDARPAASQAGETRARRSVSRSAMAMRVAHLRRAGAPWRGA